MGWRKSYLALVLLTLCFDGHSYLGIAMWVSSNPLSWATDHSPICMRRYSDFALVRGMLPENQPPLVIHLNIFSQNLQTSIQTLLNMAVDIYVWLISNHHNIATVEMFPGAATAFADLGINFSDFITEVNNWGNTATSSDLAKALFFVACVTFNVRTYNCDCL